ncbi:LLM class flavin-dependent oxidoreductase [Candidatus Bathyarchaeota archaeon]|nr:MAG: LLM class flavin-dependent oxidoreductase [Candidatus Bathyarchaeota archaeon]
MDVKFGVLIGAPSPSIKGIILRAKMAEENNFDSFWIADHLLSWGEPCFEVWSILASVAMVTSKIRIGTAVSDPHRRNPALFAQTIATLDQISNGRVNVGIGPGEAMNLEPFGIRWDKPITRMVRVIELLKRFLAGETVTYEDEFFRFKDAFLQVKPIQKPYPPIYLGTNSPRSREITGQIADGWITIGTPKLVKEDLEDIKKGAEKAGRKLEEIDRVIFAYTAVSQKSDEAFKAAEKWAKAFLIPMCKKLNKIYGLNIPEEFSIEKVLITKDTIKKIYGLAENLSDDVVKEFNVVGNIDECLEKIDKFIKVGITHFALLNVGPNIEEVFKIYSKKIIPHFKKYK